MACHRRCATTAACSPRNKPPRGAPSAPRRSPPCTHQATNVDNNLTVASIDEPVPGGAHHAYRIDGYSTVTNSSAPYTQRCVEIFFQKGTIPENGVNGVTIEALLAVCADRLQGFQNGPYPCQENEDALQGICHALATLHSRTLKRIRRGVEGTHQP